MLQIHWMLTLKLKIQLFPTLSTVDCHIDTSLSFIPCCYMLTFFFIIILGFFLSCYFNFFIYLDKTYTSFYVYTETETATALYSNFLF